MVFRGTNHANGRNEMKDLCVSDDPSNRPITISTNRNFGTWIKTDIRGPTNNLDGRRSMGPQLFRLWIQKRSSLYDHTMLDRFLSRWHIPHSCPWRKIIFFYTCALWCTTGFNFGTNTTSTILLIEPRHEKTCLRGFRQGTLKPACAPMDAR